MKCRICGKEFSPNYYHRKFCSIICKVEAIKWYSREYQRKHPEVVKARGARLKIKIRKALKKNLPEEPATLSELARRIGYATHTISSTGAMKYLLQKRWLFKLKFDLGSRGGKFGVSHLFKRDVINKCFYATTPIALTKLFANSISPDVLSHKGKRTALTRFFKRKVLPLWR